MIDFNIKKETSLGGFRLDAAACLESGGVLGVYGEAGVGKSLLLSMFTGAVSPDEGYIRVGVDTWFSANHFVNLRPKERRLVFLDAPHLLRSSRTLEAELRRACGDPRRAFALADTFELRPHLGTRLKDLPALMGWRVGTALASAATPVLYLFDLPRLAADEETEFRFCVQKIRQDKKRHVMMCSEDAVLMAALASRLYTVQSGKLLTCTSDFTILNTMPYDGCDYSTFS